MTDWYPKLEGKVDWELDQALRIAFNNLYSLRNQLQSVEKSVPSPGLTLEQIRAALQVGGSTVMNLTGLPGTSAGAQPLTIQGVYSTRPAVTTSDDGTFFWATDRNVLYLVEAGVWVYVAGTMQDTFANRPAVTAADDNMLFYATDQDTHWQVVAGAWKYICGVYKRTQAQLAALAGVLVAGDIGLLVEVTDFYHTMRWTGAVWEWGPGETGAHEIAGFPVSPPLGWVLCDGAVTSFLNGTGTVTAFTTPNLVGQYLKFNNGGYTSTLPAGGAVADESAHVHSIDPPETDSGAPSATTAVCTTTTAVNVGSATHTHKTDIAAFDSAAGSAHDHGPGTLELARTELLPYFRR